MSWRISIFVTLIFNVLPRIVGAFSHSECQTLFQELSKQNKTTINGMSFNKTSKVVSYDVCEAVCGPYNNKIVKDWVGRLCSWVLPMIILTFSVQLPPLARMQKIWAVVRMIGEPIGSLLWMLDELRLYNYCLSQAEEMARNLETNHSPNQDAKNGSVVTYTNTQPTENAEQDVVGNCARILHAVSKLVPGKDPLETREYLETAMSKMSDTGQRAKELEEQRKGLEAFHKQVNESGKLIIGLKSRSTMKSVVAVLCFLVPVVLALIPVLSPPASGAMLPPILALSPLLLIVLLNGAIGEYLDLVCLSKAVGEIEGIIAASLSREARKELGPLLSSPVSKEDTHLLKYTSMVKRECTRLEWMQQHVLDATLLLIFPLAIGLAGGAIGTAPTFFNDRHIVLIGVFVAWIMSWGITSWGKDKEGAWPYLIAGTHYTVAISVMVFLAAATCGWLGTCKMWTGYYLYGPKQAKMPLNLDDVWAHNNKIVYPALATACLGLNLAAFVFLRHFFFQRPFRVITGEKVRTGSVIVPV